MCIHVCLVLAASENWAKQAHNVTNKYNLTILNNFHVSHTNQFMIYM